MFLLRSPLRGRPTPPLELRLLAMLATLVSTGDGCVCLSRLRCLRRLSLLATLAMLASTSDACDDSAYYFQWFAELAWTKPDGVKESGHANVALGQAEICRLRSENRNKSGNHEPVVNGHIRMCTMCYEDIQNVESRCVLVCGGGGSAMSVCVWFCVTVHCICVSYNVRSYVRVG
jgi:hypothetical protein